MVVGHPSCTGTTSPTPNLSWKFNIFEPGQFLGSGPRFGNRGTCEWIRNGSALDAHIHFCHSCCETSRNGKYMHPNGCSDPSANTERLPEAMLQRFGFFSDSRLSDLLYDVALCDFVWALIASVVDLVFSRLHWRTLPWLPATRRAMLIGLCSMGDSNFKARCCFWCPGAIATAIVFCVRTVHR